MCSTVTIFYSLWTYLAFQKQSSTETQLCPFVYIVCSCFSAKAEEFNNYNTDRMAHKLQNS